VSPRAGLDTEARGKILSPLLGIEPRSPGRPARTQTLYRLSTRLTHYRLLLMFLIIRIVAWTSIFVTISVLNELSKYQALFSSSTAFSFICTSVKCRNARDWILVCDVFLCYVILQCIWFFEKIDAFRAVQNALVKASSGNENHRAMSRIFILLVFVISMLILVAWLVN
jgi:hypothetical protein